MADGPGAPAPDRAAPPAQPPPPPAPRAAGMEQLRQAFRTQSLVPEAPPIFALFGIPWESASIADLQRVERTVGLIATKRGTHPQLIPDLHEIFQSSDLPRSLKGLYQLEGYVADYPLSEEMLDRFVSGCDRAHIPAPEYRQLVEMTGQRRSMEFFLRDLSETGFSPPLGCDPAHHPRVLHYGDLFRESLEEQSAVEYILTLAAFFQMDPVSLYSAARPHLPEGGSLLYDNAYTAEEARAIVALARSYPSLPITPSDLPLIIENSDFLTLVGCLATAGTRPSCPFHIDYRFKPTRTRLGSWPEALNPWVQNPPPGTPSSHLRQGRLALLATLFPDVPTAQLEKTYTVFGDQLFEVADVPSEILFSPTLPATIDRLERFGKVRPRLVVVKPLLTSLAHEPRALNRTLHALQRTMAADRKTYEKACRQKLGRYGACRIHQGKINWKNFVTFYQNRQRALAVMDQMRKKYGFRLVDWLALDYATKFSEHAQALALLDKLRPDFSTLSGYVGLIQFSNLTEHPEITARILKGEIDQGLTLLRRLSATKTLREAYNFDLFDFSLLRAVGTHPDLFSPYQTMSGCELRKGVNDRLAARSHYLRLARDDPDYREDTTVDDQRRYPMALVLKIDLMQRALESEDFRNTVGNRLLEDYRDERGEHGGLILPSERGILTLSLRLEDVGRDAGSDPKQRDGGYHFPNQYRPELREQGLFETHFHSVKLSNLDPRYRDLRYFTGPSGSPRSFGGDFFNTHAHSVVFALIHDAAGEVSFVPNVYDLRANVDLGSYSFTPHPQNQAIAQEFLAQLPR